MKTSIMREKNIQNIIEIYLVFSFPTLYTTKLTHHDIKPSSAFFLNVLLPLVVQGFLYIFYRNADVVIYVNIYFKIECSSISY